MSNSVITPQIQSTTGVQTTTIPLNNTPNKRVKVTLACTVCRKKKVKCDGIQPCCSRCNTMGLSCQYSDPPKKRGPPKGQVEIISSRAHRIKSLQESATLQVNHKTPLVTSASSINAIRCYSSLINNGNDTRKYSLKNNPILHLISGAVDAVQQDTPGSHYLKNDFLINDSQQWISGYFDYFNILFPLLSRPHFNHQLSQLDPLLVYAVYTLGSKYTDDNQETSDFLFERCQCILNMSRDLTTLSTVQALVILCWYSYLMGNMQSCSVLRQKLNRAIQDLQLYQDPGPSLGIVEIEMRRRAFWVVFVTDQWLSSSGGRFLVLPDEWHCQWPKLEDTQLFIIDSKHDNNEIILHDSAEYALQITAFSEMIKLACILDDMHHYQQTMVSRLTDWLLNLPSYLEYGQPNDHSPPSPIARIYHMLYYTIQIMLHQPLLEDRVKELGTTTTSSSSPSPSSSPSSSSPSPSSSSSSSSSSRNCPDTITRTICTNAANTIVHIAEQMIQHDHHAHLLNTFMTSVTLATWVHLDNTIQVQKTHDVTSFLSLNRSVQALKYSNSTALSSSALGQLLDQYLMDHHGISLKTDLQQTSDQRKRRRRRRRESSSADSTRSSTLTSPLTSPWENPIRDDLLDTRLFHLLHTTPTLSSASSSVCSQSPLDPTWLHETSSILDWFSPPDFLYSPISPSYSPLLAPAGVFKSDLFYPPSSMELYAFMAQN